MFFKTFDSELSYIELWFTDRYTLDIKDKIIITLVIN